MNVAELPPRNSLASGKLVFHRVYEPELSGRDLANITTIAEHILRERPLLARIPPFGPLCARGLVDAPSLLIEDHSGIQLAHERGADRNLSYRAAVLAGDGDLLAVYGERQPAFETYCREVLRLGDFTTIAPPIADPVQSLSQACLADGRLLANAVEIARTAGALNVLPYMSTGGAWRLAAEIARRSGVPVTVAAPGPLLARTVNDKLWFVHCAALLLGREAVPHNRTVYGMAALVGHLRRFMTQHHVVGLKLPHSAASLGNMVLTSAELTGLSPTALAARLAEAMEQRGWQRPFPLQVTAWEGPLLGSPSAQLWIPHPEDGAPIVEAIFDQITTGAIARFVGGVPSTLGPKLKREFAHEAACLGALFQHLGYFGRCSFDAVIVGEDEDSAELHWVECNGRWGGMSLPMTLANRLVGDWRSGGFLVFSHFDPDGVPDTVPALLERCDDLLFRPERPSGLVVLTPGRIARGGVDLMVLADDQAAAQRLGDEAIARLSA